MLHSAREKEAVKKAIEFVNSLYPDGGTNIYESVMTALTLVNLNICIFICIYIYKHINRSRTWARETSSWWSCCFILLSVGTYGQSATGISHAERRGAG